MSNQDLCPKNIIQAIEGMTLSRGELNGQSTFMEEKYTVESDCSLLMKMSRLFK